VKKGFLIGVLVCRNARFQDEKSRKRLRTKKKRKRRIERGCERERRREEEGIWKMCKDEDEAEEVEE
jgi:hypothetical protein